MYNKNTYLAKPFVKWAGGKAQLIFEIESRLPQSIVSGESVTYVEPFVGGGAVLFYLLSKYPNIKHAVINDINSRLCTTFQVVKNLPTQLIARLHQLQNEYLPKNHDERAEMYVCIRDKFNTGGLSNVETAALFIFLNRTCFNGLYRENSKGMFNVPHGRYSNPCICDEATILADNAVLQRVTILNGDFSSTLKYANSNSFFYFDPPYKPLNDTSSFNSYVKEPFNDDEQRRLCRFIQQVADKGSYFILSNSDAPADNPNERFFDSLYSHFTIDRVLASRMVNADPNKRGKLTELMITNILHNSQSSDLLGMMVSEPIQKYGKR